MSFAPVGDLARHLMIRRHTSAIKGDIDRLADMMASGRKADLPASLRGDLAPLNGITASLARLEGWSFAANGLSTRMEAMQAAMSSMRSLGDTAAKGFLIARMPDQIEQAAKGAGDTLEALLQHLNARVGDTWLFSGTATDGQAVRSAEDLFAALLPEVSGLATPQEVADRVVAWMEEPTGFAAQIYLGGPKISAINVSAQDRIAHGVTATDPGFAKLLGAAALGALLDHGLFAGDQLARQQTAELTGELFLSSAQDSVNLAAKLGQSQEKLQRVMTQNAAERSALQIIRNETLRAPPEQTAAELTAASTQLELLFEMTARLSSLSLLNALR